MGMGQGVELVWGTGASAVSYRHNVLVCVCVCVFFLSFFHKGNNLYNFLFPSLDGLALSKWYLPLKERIGF